jgi:hypothetical protein
VHARRGAAEMQLLGHGDELAQHALGDHREAPRGAAVS